MANLIFTPVTIANGGTTTDAVDLEGKTLVGLFTDSTMTGTAITFQTALSTAGTFVNIEDGDGANISKTMSGGEYIKLNPQDFAGCATIKLVSGSAEGAERTLNLAMRQFV